MDYELRQIMNQISSTLVIILLITISSYASNTNGKLRLFSLKNSNSFHNCTD